MKGGGEKEGGQENSAPTGCYKCGRPGHWSRDCPDQNPTTDPNPNNPNIPQTFNNNNINNINESEKKKRVRVGVLKKTRPKLTPDLLLSDDGIGFVLKHFPSSFHFHGHGHEVSDLGNLIGLYAEWHSHLIPYFSFDQFVNKVEQVGTTRRVKLCLRGLRDKVANGGDLTKLHESPVEDNSNDKEEAMDVEEPDTVREHAFNENHDTDNLQEDFFQELYNQATEEPNPSNVDVAGTTGLSQSHNNPTKDSTNETSETVENASNIAKQKQLSDEQKARMEANRLKAMEKAAARARSAQVA